MIKILVNALFKQISLLFKHYGVYLLIDHVPKIDFSQYWPHTVQTLALILVFIVSH